MENNLGKVKKGDIVWSISNGWTEIENIIYTTACPIKTINGFTYTIKLTNGSSYTNTGKRFKNDKYPSLFLEPPIGFNALSKPCKYKRGQRVLVRDHENHSWERRYFKEHKTNLDYAYFCFCDGVDEWASKNNKSTGWKYCKPWEDHNEIL